jgi:hypothetical protein
MPAYLRDASELLWPAAKETVAVLDIDPDGKDALAVKAVLRIARIIDETSDAKQANVYRWLMPELTRLLEQLGATPAARAAMKKNGKPGNAKPDGLAKLRAAREA